MSAPIPSRLLDLLVCPVSREKLHVNAQTDELWCAASGLAYPVRDGVPVMLEDAARELTREERRSLAGEASGAEHPPCG